MLVVKEHVPINFFAVVARLLSKKQGAVQHSSQIKTELKAVETVRLLRPRGKNRVRVAAALCIPEFDIDM